MGKAGFVNDFMGSSVAAASTRFLMPEFEDGSRYEPGDPIYDAVADHFTPEVWNGLEEEARWSVIETLEESLPPPSAAPIRENTRPNAATSMLSALDKGSRKARMPFGPPDIKGLFGGKRRGK